MLLNAIKIVLYVDFMDELRKILIILSLWEILHIFRGFLPLHSCRGQTSRGEPELPSLLRVPIVCPDIHTQNSAPPPPSPTWKPSLRKLCVVRLGNTASCLVSKTDSLQDFRKVWPHIKEEVSERAWWGLPAPLLDSLKPILTVFPGEWQKPSSLLPLCLPLHECNVLAGQTGSWAPAPLWREDLPFVWQLTVPGAVLGHPHPLLEWPRGVRKPPSSNEARPQQQWYCLGSC